MEFFERSELHSMNKLASKRWTSWFSFSDCRSPALQFNLFPPFPQVRMDSWSAGFRSPLSLLLVLIPIWSTLFCLRWLLSISRASYRFVRNIPLLISYLCMTTVLTDDSHRHHSRAEIVSPEPVVFKGRWLVVTAK